MKKSVKITLLLISLLFIATLMAVLVKKQPAQILFYSKSCPHCQIVDKYIDENNVKSYLVFDELEVSTNQANTQLLIRKAKSCGLPTEGLGVPFFYDGTKCLVGDQEIINYFSSKK